MVELVGEEVATGCRHVKLSTAFGIPNDDTPAKMSHS